MQHIACDVLVTRRRSHATSYLHRRVVAGAAPDWSRFRVVNGRLASCNHLTGRESIRTLRSRRQLAHGRHLAGCPRNSSADLPARPPLASYMRYTIPFEIPLTSRDLLRLGRDRRLSLFMVVQAGPRRPAERIVRVTEHPDRTPVRRTDRALGDVVDSSSTPSWLRTDLAG